MTRIMCETSQDAADAAAEWEQRAGFACEIDDLAVGHGPDDVLAPEPEDILEADDFREPDMIATRYRAETRHRTTLRRGTES